MINRDGIGYRELAAVLRERITSGALRPGDRLPSESALVQEYGVARVTAQRAIRELGDEGLVTIRHGYPTRVRAEGPVSEVAIQRGSTWRVRMPTPAERDEHGIPRGVPVVEVRYGASVRVYPGDRHTFTAK